MLLTITGFCALVTILRAAYCCFLCYWAWTPYRLGAFMATCVQTPGKQLMFGHLTVSGLNLYILRDLTITVHVPVLWATICTLEE